MSAFFWRFAPEARDPPSAWRTIPIGTTPLFSRWNRTAHSSRSHRQIVPLACVYLICSNITAYMIRFEKNRGRPHSTSLAKSYFLFPLDGVGSAVPSLQLHPVFGIDTERVPPNDAMSRFVGFGDKSWDNLKNFFQTQGFEFLFLSQSARRVAFGGSMAPKTPVLKLNRPFARKPPAAIASELTRVACAPFAKPQVAGLRHS